MVIATDPTEAKIVTQLKYDHTVDVAISTATLVVENVFVAQDGLNSQYGWTARDTADRHVFGIATETLDNRLNTTTVELLPIAPFGSGLHPVATSTALNPGQALHVLAPALGGDGNILTDTGNVQVAEVICAANWTGQTNPNAAGYVWDVFNTYN